MDRPSRFKLNRNTPMGRALYGAPLALLGRGACNSGMAWDSGAYGNHGTLTNFADPFLATSGPVWVPELGRWGWAFDGSNDWINFVDITLGVSAAFSESVWIRPVASGDYQIIAKGTASGYRVDTLYLSGTGNTVSVRSSLSAFVVSAAIIPSTWNHICVTGGNGLFLWINGVLVNSGVGTAYYLSGITALGYASGINEQYYGSLLSDYAVFNRVLTLPEIQLLASRDPMLGGAIVGVGRRGFVGWRQSSNRRRRLLLCS